MHAITSLVERMLPHVRELADRIAARAPIDAFVLMLVDARSELGEMLLVPEATIAGISLYALPLASATPLIRELDEDVATSLVDVPAAGEVRLVVIAGGAVALLHVPNARLVAKD